MLTIYNAKETNFDNNGLGVLLASESVVTEELNGMYELKVVCPAQVSGNKAWTHLQEQHIIKAPTPSGDQLFRVYNVNKTIDNVITANARHIFYDCLYNAVPSKKLSGVTADAVLKELFKNAYVTNDFRVSSNMTGTADIVFEDTNLVDVILGDDGIATTFGGELYRDNYNISLLTAVGADRGFTIRYGKNLTGLDVEINMEDVATRIVPIAQTKDGDPLYLPERYVDSPNINNYFMPIVAIQDYRDIRVGYDDYMTNDSAYTEMRQRVQQLFDSGADQPAVNAKVDFVLLKDTAEYKEFSFLEDIRLGDTVTVIHENLGVNTKAKCIKYTYDAILEKYKQIEIGEFRQDLLSSVNREISRTVSSGSGRVSGAEITDLWSLLENHTHTGADGTKQISKSDLLE